MKPFTLEWVAKAEGDFAMVEREARVRKNPNYDGLCFHAQQCVEKYIKARLYEADIDFPKTHVLAALLDLALPVEPLWESFREHLIFLTGFAVSFRYPGESVDKQTALDARQRCRLFRRVAREALELKD